MTVFTPQVDRIYMDHTAYPGYLDSAVTYQTAKIEDLADILVTMSSGWAEPWTRVGGFVYSSYTTWVILERPNGSDKEQIILAYVRWGSDWGGGIANTFEGDAHGWRLWICYKPSTSGSLMDTTGSVSPRHASLCSGGNSFLFHPAVADGEHFHDTLWWYVWLAEESSRRTVLINENTAREVVCISIMGEDVIQQRYNTGLGRWTGGSVVPHPDPDLHSSVFFTGDAATQIWTPQSSEFPGVIQWYDIDHNPDGLSNSGLAIRDELLQANPGSDPPYPREPAVIYKNERKSVWADSSNPHPIRGNGLKGVIDPDFVSWTASHDLSQYTLLNGGDYIHIKDGLCIGWNPAHGPMP